MIRFGIFDFGCWIRRTKSTKSLSFGLAALLFALSLPAEAQQQKKVHRIGLLTTGFPDSLPHLINAFKQGLRDHGYVEGQNVLLELRYAEAQAERLPILAAELVHLKVDVIVAIPNPAIDALKQATQTIPIVMPIGSDPVGVGFVASLARPGGNITGLSAYSPELNGKRLEIFKETIPKLSQVALLTSPNVRGNTIDLKDTELAGSLSATTDSIFQCGKFLRFGRCFQKHDQRALRRFHRLSGSTNIVCESATSRGTRGKEPFAGNISVGGLRRRRRSYLLRREQS